MDRLKRAGHASRRTLWEVSTKVRPAKPATSRGNRFEEIGVGVGHIQTHSDADYVAMRDLTPACLCGNARPDPGLPETQKERSDAENGNG